MKSYLPLLTFAVILTSCSSVYKSGQTPDDVYFSPERPREEYVRVDNEEERRYNNDEASREDRYLRMKTQNRRYGLLDEEYDYYTYTGSNYYRYSDYYRMNAFRYNTSWSTWNYRFGGFYNDPFYYNPYHCNPYYSGVVYGNINPKYNKPRSSNLHVFDANGSTYNPNVPSNRRTIGGSSNNDNYRSSGSNAGGFLRDVFNGGSNNSNNSSSAGKVSTPSNSSSNSSSSSSSSGSSRAPVRRF